MDYEPTAKDMKESAKAIMAIAAESPEKGNAVMDLIEGGWAFICEWAKSQLEE